MVGLVFHPLSITGVLSEEITKFHRHWLFNLLLMKTDTLPIRIIFPYSYAMFYVFVVCLYNFYSFAVFAIFSLYSCLAHLCIIS